MTILIYISETRRRFHRRGSVVKLRSYSSSFDIRRIENIFIHSYCHSFKGIRAWSTMCLRERDITTISK
jgi:hypothetical protein